MIRNINRVRSVLLSDLKIFYTYFKSRIIYAIKEYLNFNSRIIYAIRRYFYFKTMLMYFRDNVCILGIFRVQDKANICILGISRVYGDISSYHLHILHCKIMAVNHVTHLIFHGECTNNVEMYESKLVPCGQFYTLFSL